ncbi:methyl-accepting chemotaxis protein [Bacillus pinisoli]|uniref:methyl-accepting chemotaxis protein n=1 Tax=Bacillus pinisoli TaxID=2901866 RepID=UPI001FF514AD|nr:methyl-accepting chemotaxis protein [Bacillus pinisoli]
MSITFDHKEAGHQTVTFPVGAIIFQEGDLSREMYSVIKGKVNIFIESEGNMIQVAQFKPGDFFGEMALLEGLPRSGTAVAAEAAELLVVSEENFIRSMKSDNELPWKVMKALSMRIRHQNQTIAERVGKDLSDVAERINNNSGNITASIKRIASAAREIEGNGIELASHMKEIEIISRQIEKALSFIKQVALQTKIFGLNASIEAARSGEHGRGMKVIAEEIRKLSELTQSNAEDIFQLTNKISTEINKVTISSTNTAEKSHSQTNAINDMVQAVEEMNNLSSRILEIAGDL